MLEYCEKKNIPVKATAKKPYSSDENCLHISYEAGDLEDPTVDGTSVIDFGMSVKVSAGGSGQRRNGYDPV
jgi:argininosuccinate synthase